MATTGTKNPRIVTLEFVNISNPEEIHDPQNQSVVRRKARKRGSKKNLSYQNRSQIIKTTQRLDSRNDIPPEEKVSLRANSPLRFDITRSYPAAPFPIKLSSRAVQIVEFVMQGGDGSYCPLKELWWNMGLFDSTAFLVTLANASRVIGQYTLCGIQETPEAITYYTKSVRSLQRRIESIEDRLSEGVIVAVLEFAYYDFVSQNLQRWLIHMNGFHAIINRRGGIQSLKSSYMIQLLCFWIDVSGSFIFDRKPFFEPPHHLLHDVKDKSPPSPLLQKYINRFPELPKITTFLSETANLTTFIDEHFNGSRVMEDDKFLSKTFNIYVHKLLSLPRLNDYSRTDLVSPHLIVQEAARRACMILFALLRERFSIIPSGLYEHKNLLKEILLQHDVDWTPYLELRLWVLAIAALAADGGDIQWCVDEICGTATQMGLLDWDEVLGVLQQTLWMEPTFKDEENRIRDMFKLSNSL